MRCRWFCNSLGLLSTKNERFILKNNSVFHYCETIKEYLHDIIQNLVNIRDKVILDNKNSNQVLAEVTEQFIVNAIAQEAKEKYKDVHCLISTNHILQMLICFTIILIFNCFFSFGFILLDFICCIFTITFCFWYLKA